MKGKLPAIFAALNDEIRTIRSRMIVDEQTHFRPVLVIRGQIEKQNCLLVRTGVGKKAMHQAVKYCLENYNPTHCLNIGYAGGTTPKMIVGDLLLADPVVDAASKAYYIADHSLLKKIEALCVKNKLRYYRGGLVTVEEVIETPHEKAFIGTEHEALALDMESSAFMQECKKHKKPAVVVRSIFDALDVKLPYMKKAIDESGEVNLAGVAGHVISHPKDILALPKMEYYASKAREALTDFIQAWISIL
ncbi:MAG: hypothetical protein ABH859_05295 [Pseudomonadota bacterium]